MRSNPALWRPAACRTRYWFIVALVLTCLPLGIALAQPDSPADEAPAPAASQLPPDQPELTRELLEESLALARQHMLSVQTERGDFYYLFDYVTGDLSGSNSHVRQAGGLWALASLQFADPSEDTRQAVLRGIRFFNANCQPAEAGGAFLHYPDTNEGATGAMALLALAEIEFLRSEPAGEVYDEVAGYLNSHLDFLLTLQFADGRFPSHYDHDTGAGSGIWSPYYDGESLLAFTKAAAYLGREDLVPILLPAAHNMWTSYIRLPAETGDRKTPTQFYQWGSMAFYEIHKAGWEGHEIFAERTLDMALERLEEIKRLPPTGNYGSRYEGLSVAWEIARQTGDTEAQAAIGQQIRRGVIDLMRLQVGHSLASEYIQANPPGSDISLGGCLMRDEDPRLRIDCVQHQAHALLLTRRFLFDGP